MFTVALIILSLLIFFIAVCVVPWWMSVGLLVGGILWILFGPKKY